MPETIRPSPVRALRSARVACMAAGISFALALLVVTAAAASAQHGDLGSRRLLADTLAQHAQRARRIEARLPQAERELVALGRKLLDAQSEMLPVRACGGDEARRFVRASQASGASLRQVVFERPRRHVFWDEYPCQVEVWGDLQQIASFAAHLQLQSRWRLETRALHLRALGEPSLRPLPQVYEARFGLLWRIGNQDFLATAAGVDHEGLAAFDLPPLAPPRDAPAAPDPLAVPAVGRRCP